MLKRHNRFFASMLFLHDLTMVVTAFVFAYHARFSFPKMFPFDERATIAATQSFFYVCVLAWPIAAQVAGLYRSQRTNSVTGELFRIFRASTVALVAVVTIA